MVLNFIVQSCRLLDWEEALCSARISICIQFPNTWNVSLITVNHCQLQEFQLQFIDFKLYFLLFLLQSNGLQDDDDLKKKLHFLAKQAIER